MSTDDSKQVDISKPVSTRDGREVRIYTQQGRHPTRVVVGEVCDGADVSLDRWYANGSYFNDGRLSKSDLVNVLQKHTVWVNIYPHAGCGTPVSFKTHGDRASADEHAKADRIACFEVTFTEGEGLE